jgi:hypothetical protein
VFNAEIPNNKYEKVELTSLYLFFSRNVYMDEKRQGKEERREERGEGRAKSYRYPAGTTVKPERQY